MSALGLAVAAALLCAAPLADQENASGCFVVRGIVLDSSLRPVAGASVTATPLLAGGTACPERAAETRAAADGRFSLALDAMPTLLRLEARAPGLAPGAIDHIAPATSPHEAGALFLLPAVELTGRVTDGEGRPLAGAVLFAAPAWRLPLAEALEPAAFTAADGSYRIAGLPPAAVWIGAAAAGRADAVRAGLDLTDPRRREIDFVLEEAPVAGGVVLGPDGQPLAGARVEALWPGGGAPFFRRPATTGADGRFLLEGLPAERSDIEVHFSAPGFHEAVLPAAALGKDSAVTLAHAPLLRLVAAPAEPPVVLSAARCDAYTRAGEGWRRAEKTFGPDQARIERPGCWVVAAPPGDVVRVFAEAADGRVAPAIEVETPATGESVEVRFEFAPLGEVAGRVLTADGMPPPDPLAVELGSAQGASWLVVRTTRCAPDGSFSFAGLPDGACGVRARSGDWLSDWLPVPAGTSGAPAALTITARPAARLSGTVTVNGERPRLPLVVTALAYDRGARAFRAVATTATGAEGRFSLAPLPAGAIALWPEPPPDPEEGACRRGEEPALPADLRGWSWLARLEEGEAAVLNIDLTQPDRSWLSGVFEVNGTRRAGALLALSRPGGDARQTAASDEAGRFRFRVEGEGTFLLEVESGGPRAALPVEIEAGIDRAIAWDVAAGSVSGRLLAPDGASGLRVLLQIERTPSQDDPSCWTTRDQTLASPDGRYLFPEVEARRVRMAAEDPSGGLAMAATVPFEGRAREPVAAPDLALPLAAALEAVMRLPAGQKPPFARLEIEAAAGQPELPRPFTGWFVETKARVTGLPPGRVRARLVPYGPYEASPAQEIDLPADGSHVTLEFEVRQAGA